MTLRKNKSKLMRLMEKSDNELVTKFAFQAAKIAIGYYRILAKYKKKNTYEREKVLRKYVRKKLAILRNAELISQAQYKFCVNCPGFETTSFETVLKKQKKKKFQLCNRNYCLFCHARIVIGIFRKLANMLKNNPFSYVWCSKHEVPFSLQDFATFQQAMKNPLLTANTILKYAQRRGDFSFCYGGFIFIWPKLVYNKPNTGVVCANAIGIGENPNLYFKHGRLSVTNLSEEEQREKWIMSLKILAKLLGESAQLPKWLYFSRKNSTTIIMKKFMSNQRTLVRFGTFRGKSNNSNRSLTDE